MASVEVVNMTYLLWQKKKIKNYKGPLFLKDNWSQLFLFFIRDHYSLRIIGPYYFFSQYYKCWYYSCCSGMSGLNILHSITQSYTTTHHTKNALAHVIYKQHSFTKNSFCFWIRIVLLIRIWFPGLSICYSVTCFAIPITWNTLFFSNTIPSQLSKW